MVPVMNPCLTLAINRQIIYTKERNDSEDLLSKLHRRFEIKKIHESYFVNILRKR